MSPTHIIDWIAMMVMMMMILIMVVMMMILTKKVYPFLYLQMAAHRRIGRI